MFGELLGTFLSLRSSTFGKCHFVLDNELSTVSGQEELGDEVFRSEAADTA